MELLIVELVISAQLSGAALMTAIADRLPGVTLDQTYGPIEIKPRAEDASRLAQGQKVVVVRCKAPVGQRNAVKAIPGVLNVWTDARVEPFQKG